jgi:DNA polymerase
MTINSSDLKQNSMVELILKHSEECLCCNSTELSGLIVFGKGRLDSEIFIVGEAPGINESICGEPFIGRAGHLLRRLLENAKIKEKNCYFTNILKRHPLNNRTPSAHELKECGRFLLQQIEIVRPKVIISLGLSAASLFASRVESMGKMHGKWSSFIATRNEEYINIPVMMTYHPSWALRDDRVFREKIIFNDICLSLMRI